MQREQPTRVTASTEAVTHVKREYARAPGTRSTGVSLRDVLRRWKVGPNRLYQLETDGKLLAIEVGSRVYYAEAQLRSILGDPEDDSGGAERSPSPVWAALSA